MSAGSGKGYARELGERIGRENVIETVSGTDEREWREKRDLTEMIHKKESGRNFIGYGWPATLDLLLPPIGRPVDSQKMIKMLICPSCKSVHESGGNRIFSRHRHPIPFNSYNDGFSIWNRSLTQDSTTYCYETAAVGASASPS